jgi:aconitate decarboxylase
LRQVVREVLLDGLANLIAGSAEPLATPIAAYVRDLAGPERATVVGHEFKTHPVHAAFANAIFSHSMDFELVSYPPTHPVSPVLPPLLALSEGLHLDVEQFSLALIAGLEVTGALRSGKPTTWGGIHPPGSYGMMGAAAACAKALGLGVDQTRMTLGIAASRISGLMANTGTMTKATHCGHAARMGLESALLAQRGVTASMSVLEAKDGYNEVLFRGEADLTRCREPFGRPYWILDPGLAVKKYPAQYTTHWSIDAALQIQRHDPVNAGRIESVEIEVGANHPAARRPIPSTGLDGKFSLQYTVAAALLDGSVGIDTFRDSRLHSEDMQRLLPLIHLVKNSEVDAEDFNLARSTVTVHAAGRAHSAEVTRPPGIWDRPLPWHDRVRKYRECAARVLDEDDMSAVLDVVSNFDTCDDVAAVMTQLGTGRRSA